MVNFRDPVVAGQDYLFLKSLHHTTNGIYLWEFFTTLDYEFNIVRGRRPYRWTIWIYSLTRVAALIAVILNFIGLNSTIPINCQLWVIFSAFFGYLGCTAAALLIVLRIVAIWNGDKIVVAIATSLWVTDVATVIQGKSLPPNSYGRLRIFYKRDIISGIARLRSSWYDFLPGCIVFNSHIGEPNLIVTLVTDTVLLLIMLAGLFRLRRQGGDTIGSLLWKQGVLWLLFATMADVPPAVLTIMNLNDPLNLICLQPAMVIMSIAGTRMYRSLSDFSSGTSVVVSDGHNANVSKLQWSPFPRGSGRIEATVDTESYGRSRMSRTSQHDAYIISTEGQQPREKPHGSNLNDSETSVKNSVPV